MNELSITNGIVVIVLGLSLSVALLQGGSFNSASASSNVAAKANSQLPDGCKVDQVRKLLVEFAQTANNDDLQGLVQRISPAPELKGVKVSFGRSRKSFRSESQKGAASYFLRRSRKGERLRLLSAGVSFVPPGRPELESGPYSRPSEGPAAEDPVASFGPTYRLRGGKKPLRILSGKGAINCATGQIYILMLQQSVVEGVGRIATCGSRHVSAKNPPRRPVICETGADSGS
jgi:hypothetical protein